jgi:hypothetical protein
MQRGMRRGVAAAVTAIGVAASIVLAIPSAFAHVQMDDDHMFDKRNERFLGSQNDQHLPATRHNVESVSKLKLSGVGEGNVADVGVHGNFAYLANFGSAGCESRGVWIVDISDPEKPREVKFLATAQHSYVGEGVQAIRLETPKFTGDVLVYSAEPCSGGEGGATLVDVTDPWKATPVLSEFGVRKAPGEPMNPAHSVFLWTDGPKAYAVMTDNPTLGGSIFDISDPRAPVKVADYDLPKQFPQILQPNQSRELLFHDFVVKKIDGRQVMLASNWDAGYVKLDVTDPANPVYLGDSDSAEFDAELFRQRGIKQKPEGNAHEAEFTADNKYIVAADEDFAPGKARLTSDAIEMAVDAYTIGRPMEADFDAITVYAGDACPSRPVPPAPSAPDNVKKVAVIEAGNCLDHVKHDAVVAAGYDGAVVTSGLTCESNGRGDGTQTIPMMWVGRRSNALKVFGYDTSQEHRPDCAKGEPPAFADIRPGTVGSQIRFKTWFDGWGHVRLFSNNDGKLVELDTYAIPEGMNPDIPSFGMTAALSVHEVATSPTRADLAYIAYYAGGFRVVSLAGGKIKEVGRFIDDQGTDLWGVQVFNRGGQEFVAASDRSYGLQIFKYTGTYG